MRTDYSKPSSDIAQEAEHWQARDRETLERQRELTRYLERSSNRSICLLCGRDLVEAERIRHRSVEYVRCARCMHVQTRKQLPAGYPDEMAGSGFETIYPRLDKRAYASRRDRIYTPKLEWALSCMETAGTAVSDALEASWLEIGCGAGYFLDALRAKGASDFQGLDENADLVEIASEMCGPGRARVTRDLFADLEASETSVVAAFFVLEHLETAERFWRVMSGKPSGTHFLFAVPTFGFATIMEGALDSFAARNLDSVVHTQLYTDASIDFALEASGYNKVAEWLFGQDASDLCQLLINRVAPVASDAIAAELRESIGGLMDPLQSAIDRARLSDARHVLAVKR